MSQALSGVFFMFFNSLARPNVSKLSLVNGLVNGRELNLQCRRGLSLFVLNGFLADEGDSNPKALLTKLKSSTLCLLDTNTPTGD